MDPVPSITAHPFGDGSELPDWLRGPHDNCDLPPTLRRFAEAIGRKDALRIAFALGGTSQWLNGRLSECHPISDLIGLSSARALGRHLCPEFGTLRLFIPVGPFSRSMALRRSVRELLLEGRETNDIATTTGATALVIGQVRRQLEAEGLVTPTAGGATDVGLIGGDLNESVILARALDLEGVVREGGELPDWLRGPDDNADLPETIREIADVIGRPRALLFIAYFGGSRQFFPRKFKASNRIAQVIGRESAEKLSEHFRTGLSGVEVELPRGPLTFQGYRNARMRDLILQGMPRDRIARIVGITSRNVNRAARKLRAEGFDVPKTSSVPQILEYEQNGMADMFLSSAKLKGVAP